jgi:preprotein translocase subunit SecF
MVRLRDAVVQADAKGVGVEEALQALRNHVYYHMNTDLTSGNSAIRPPIQLTKTYERLTSAEHERVAEQNRSVAATGTAICEKRFPAGQLRNGRVQCVQDYITKNSVSEDSVPKELYQFDFVSPTWSPDLAGWSLVATTIFFFLFVLRFGLERWLKHSLDEHA